MSPWPQTHHRGYRPFSALQIICFVQDLKRAPARSILAIPQELLRQPFGSDLAFAQRVMWEAPHLSHESVIWESPRVPEVRQGDSLPKHPPTKSAQKGP